MKQSAKKILLSGLVLFSIMYTFADRGLRRKSKNHVTLNINTNTNFNNDLAYNLKTGLKYKGYLLNETKTHSTFISSNFITAYQKGNTYYIVPSKMKMITPELKQGYTGLKLILKSKD